MVNTRKKNLIPDRPSPGSRVASDGDSLGHHSKSRSHGTVEYVEQSGQSTVERLEDRVKRKKWTVEENWQIMQCYYSSDPDTYGFQRRMFEIWKEKFPTMNITEQRLMDQRRYLLRNNVFTKLELEEIRRVLPETIVELEQNVSTGDIGQPVGQEHVIVDQEEGFTSRERCLQEFSLTERQEEIRNKVIRHMKQCVERRRLPPLKKTSRREMRQVLDDANCVMEKINTETLEETNQLIYSTAVIITDLLGYKNCTNINNINRTPNWKMRLEKKLQKLRVDLSNMKAMKDRRLKNEEIKRNLRTKYNLGTKKIVQVLEELKQRVTATAKKIERYMGRINQFQQNQQFRTNQHLFYRSLIESNKAVTIFPDNEEMLQYWKDIWEMPQLHNTDANWIDEVKRHVKVNRMENFSITLDMFQQQIKKIKNWSAPGQDELHGFWLKHLVGLHERIAKQFDEVLQTGKIDNWLMTGRTYLIIKDKSKGPVIDNYRPITCLPTMFKLLTGIISSVILNYLKQNSIYPPEQKGCYKNSRGAKDQLLIDKMIMKNSKRRTTNLNMAWIDYRKAFDSLPHSWILECLKICKISENICNLLEFSMKKWQTKLILNNTEIGKVKIQKGIFQGDSLSPLLFIICMIPLTWILNNSKFGYEATKTSGRISHLFYMDDLKLYGKTRNEITSLINTVRIYSQDIKMEFGIEKCAMLAVKRGKIEETEGIQLKDGKVISSLLAEESYKYLGILESDNICHKIIKEKMQSEYLKRVRKILSSKLNGGNTIKAINTWAIPLIRYTAGIVDWTQNDLDILDRKTRKLMTIHHALHTRSDINRLYLSRKIGGRGLLQVKHTVEEEKRSLKDYITISNENFLKEVYKEEMIKSYESRDEYRKMELEKRYQNWRTKPLHGQFLLQTEGLVSKGNWQWLQNGSIKKETEGLIFAAQEQALQTNSIKSRIYHITNSSRCRLCDVKDETVDHLLSGCSKIAQTDYKKRHDRVATMIHWSLCKRFNFRTNKCWFNHNIEKVTENENVKILWDFKIQTDRHLDHNTPDITVIENHMITFIDVAIPGDTRIKDKELEKMTKYRDLCIEMTRLWRRKCRVVPIVIGALGSITSNMEKYLKDIQIKDFKTADFQRTALLGSAYILRRYLDNS